MAERTGRSAVEFLFDAAKPRIERTVREHGGRVAFALPGIGDALVAALQTMGPAAFGETMMAAGGVAHISRNRFSEGPFGNALHDIVNEVIDELGQAIAHEGETLTPERATGLIQRIIGRRAGATGAAGGGTEMEEVDVCKNPDGTYTAHHPSCVLLPPSSILAGRGKDGKPRTKPNLDRRRMPRVHAKTQGIAEHGECMKIFDAVAPKEKEKLDKDLQFIDAVAAQELARQAELWRWLGVLPDDVREQVMREFEYGLKGPQGAARLRAIIDTPEANRVQIALALHDPVLERAEKLVARVGQALRGVAGQMRQGVDNVKDALNAGTIKLGKSTNAIRDKRKKGLLGWLRLTKD